MPLVPYSLRVIRECWHTLFAKKGKRPRLLTFSCPDVIASFEELGAIFDKSDLAGVKIRKDSAQICNWHKSHHISGQVVDTEDLFRVLGFDMTAIDIVQGRGGEILHDLNYPIPKALNNCFDMVFDCISNQCFNIAQVMANAVQACREGGLILSVTPVSMVNQGFYNVCPTAYHRFYEANGCAVLKREAVVGVYRLEKMIPLDHSIRCRGVDEDTMNVVLAKKKKSVDNIVWPGLSKFLRYPDCKR